MILIIICIINFQTPTCMVIHSVATIFNENCFWSSIVQCSCCKDKVLYWLVDLKQYLSILIVYFPIERIRKSRWFCPYLLYQSCSFWILLHYIQLIVQGHLYSCIIHHSTLLVLQPVPHKPYILFPHGLMLQKDYDKFNRVQFTR